MMGVDTATGGIVYPIFQVSAPAQMAATVVNMSVFLIAVESTSRKPPP